MENKTVNWYPGHMFKAKKQVQEKLKTVDAIIEIVDGRVPLSSHNKMLEEIVKAKPKMIIFSKIDLVEKNDLQKYIKEYQENGYSTLEVNINKTSYRDRIITEIEKFCQPIIDKYQKKGIFKTLRIMVIGMPNVGKSSFINLLANKKKLIVGNRPGVTKEQQIIKINEQIELLDTPGILVPKIEKLEMGYNLILNSLIKDEVSPMEEVGFYLLKYLIQNKKINQLEQRYSKLKMNDLENMDKEYDLDAIDKVYEAIAKSIGAYRNNEIDYLQVSIRLINDYRKQKFGKIILDNKLMTL